MAPTTLLTGATSGIGAALARRLGARGDRLVLVGRTDPRALDVPHPAGALAVQADLAAPDGVARIEAALDEAGITQLDRVVHSAGVGWYTDPAAATPARIRQTLRVNLEAPIALTHALLPRVETARGTLVFVSSVLADLPAPDLASYAASKAALDGFARALRVELSGRVRVVCVHPGGTATAMHEKAEVPAAMRATFRFPSAEKVAAKILRHADRGRRSPTVGFGNAMARVVGRRLGGLTEALMRKGRA